MMRGLLIASALCLPLAAHAAGPTCLPETYGAAHDGVTNDTAAIQAAIAACTGTGTANAGTVELDKGTYLSDQLVLSSFTTLQIDAGVTLLSNITYANYKSATTIPDALIILNTAADQKYVAITGSGTIEGQGGVVDPVSGYSWWTDPGAASTKPRLVTMRKGQNITVSGVTMQNSPSMHLILQQVYTANITGMTVNTPSNLPAGSTSAEADAAAPNTDGMDIEGNNLTITGNTMSGGDDNIVIKAQHTDLHDKDLPVSRNIIISGNKILLGHGISIGAQTNAGVRGVTISNNTFEGTNYGFHFKASIGQGGDVSAVTVDTATMTDVEYPIAVESYYPSVPAADTACASQAEVPYWHDIRFNNIVSSAGSGTFLPQFVGLPCAPIRKVTISNSTFVANKAPMTRNAAVDLSNVSYATTRKPSLLLGPNVHLHAVGTAAAQ
ncbi:glycoside hydrolase family 28 protein [Komagataeibacter europaeus]|uniref:glycoside hydrolase family 28 protein n=1 Tax=Komagataeibacter europaeus TaxID=33995 RepID=UPI0015FB11E4|nr:glycosyl hydrolase family 28 protein [Komagataeibacter europaeus]